LFWNVVLFVNNTDYTVNAACLVSHI